MALLLLQREAGQHRTGNIPRMPVIQLHLPQIVEHRLGSALIYLAMQRLEVTSIAPSADAHIERGVSPFIPARWNNPSRLCQHHHVQEVGNLKDVNSFPL